MVRVAINGFGRIGRLTLRAILQKYPDFDVVAVNDLTDVKTLAHLFKFDSVHKVFAGTVEVEDKHIVINGKKILALSEKDPEKLPWRNLGVDVVLESTGVFRRKEDAERHLKAGAKKVIISAPPKGEQFVRQIVLGVNEETYNPKEDSVISNASCTTNCLAPIALVLDNEFGIEKGFITTIHSVTLDQNILDAPHKDLRRARSALVNLVPTSTGAAKAVGKVLPQLEGKLDGISVRTPTPTSSLIDLVVLLKKEVTAKEINAVMKKYAESKLKGILEYSEDELVSTDIIGHPASSIFDSKQTNVNGNLVKVLSWYDNEFGYCYRTADLIAFLDKKRLVREKMLEQFNLIKDQDIKGKTILLRIDINSPVKHGRVIRGPKIIEHSKTVRLLCEKGAKVVVLSHQGRKGQDDFISLESHMELLKSLAFESIKNYYFSTWTDDYIPKIKALKEGEAIVMENTRFLDFETKKLSPEEHAENPKIKELASVADLFVLNALSVAHRSHASVVGFAPLLPSYVGFYLEKSLKALEKIEKIERNVCLILGGLKPEEPFDIMKNFLENGKAKCVLLGGILGELGLMASGKSLGVKDDFIEEKGLDKFIPELKKLMDTYPHKIKIPVDVAIEKRAKRREIPVSALPSDYPIFDVGHHTIHEYANCIEKSDLVIYSGPFGLYENSQFRSGTKEILDAIHDHSAFSFIGGGDTVTAMVGLGFRKDDFSHVSLAGGALLEFLAGQTLPGLEALKVKKQAAETVKE